MKERKNKGRRNGRSKTVQGSREDEEKIKKFRRKGGNAERRREGPAKRKIINGRQDKDTR